MIGFILTMIVLGLIAGALARLLVPGRDPMGIVATIVLGVVGSILAAAGILGRFTDFLVVLGVAFPPIAGIMVAEYFIVKRWRRELDESRATGTLPPTAPRLVPATIVIWLASAVFGYFVTWGVPAISSLVLSMVLYVVAGKLELVRGIGTAKTLQSEQPLEAAAAR